jgi:hypothetical protein
VLVGGGVMIRSGASSVVRTREGDCLVINSTIGLRLGHHSKFMLSAVIYPRKV